MPAPEHSYEVRRVCVPHALRDDLHELVGMGQAASGFGHAPGRDPGKGALAGSATKQRCDVGGRPSNRIGDLAERDGLEAVKLDELQGLADHGRMQPRRRRKC